MAEVTVFYEGPIVTRAEAKAAGQTRFFSGVPCCNGHLAQRLTCNRKCAICANLTGVGWYKRKRARPRSVTDQIVIIYSGPIVTWADAKAQGLRRYFTGKPCKYGHLAQRTFPKCTCIECIHIIAKTEAHRATARKSAAKARRAPGFKEKNAVSQSRHRKTEKFRIGLRLRSQVRRARKLAAEGTFTREDERALRDRQKKCYLCGKRFTQSRPATLDHVIPLTRGGSHSPGNIALACKSCNSRKSAIRTHLI